MDQPSSHRSSKRRGLSKAKLVMTLYRATKPSNSSTANSAKSKSVTTSNTAPSNQQYPIMVKPTNSSSPGFIFVNQDQVFSQNNPKIAFARKLPDPSYTKLENFHADEAVDAKAAKYISTVQERFRLEHIE